MRTDATQWKSGRMLKIDPFTSSGEFKTLITVVQEAGDLRWKDTQINWANLGAVDVQQTKRFVECLLYAAMVAEGWNKERAGKEL